MQDDRNPELIKIMKDILAEKALAVLGRHDISSNEFYKVASPLMVEDAPLGNYYATRSALFQLAESGYEKNTLHSSYVSIKEKQLDQLFKNREIVILDHMRPGHPGITFVTTPEEMYLANMFNQNLFKQREYFNPKEFKFGYQTGELEKLFTKLEE